MTTERRDDELLELTVRGLEERAAGSESDDVDASLRAARTAAVALATTLTEGTRPALPGTWIPAGAAVATLLMVGVITIQLAGPRMLPLNEEMFAAQHLDLLEDIELYAWMVELEQTTPASEEAG